MRHSLILISLLLYQTLSPLDGALARHTVRIGVTDGPQAEIMQEVKRVASPTVLDLRIVTFRHPESVNRALVQGRIDAATFQDAVSLEEQVKSHGYPFVAAAQTVTLPMGLFSRKLRMVRDLPEGGTVAIPKGHTDRARALVLLHNYGVIRLRHGNGFQATLRDIEKNPRRLHFVELPPGELPGALFRVSLAVIGYADAAAAGLEPARDGIGMEDGRSPYAGVLAVRAERKGEPWLKALISAYRSEPIKRFILQQYRDSVRRPW